jgi:hypothetical protein
MPSRQSARVEFSRALIGIGGSLDVSGLPLFKRLGVLRPGRTLRVFWDAAPTLFAQDRQSSPFVATVTWDEAHRPRQRASTPTTCRFIDSGPNASSH